MTTSIPVRRISFDEAMADLPRHFTADGDLITAHLVAALSAVFPEGEDYFVRSVRHFRGSIDDPTLSAQVRGFIGQEAIHGREHRAFNRRLAALGYPTLRFERMTGRMLRLRERVLPPLSNLAATAALEHFTAVLAEVLMTDEELRDSLGHPAVRELFLWHALEECEHKAVAFDVYRAVGGGERLRVLTMKALRVGFLAGTTVQVAASLLGDRATYRRGRLSGSLRRLRRSPLVSGDTWRRLREYDRPGFHPHDRDTSRLVERWREELFGADDPIDLRTDAPADLEVTGPTS